MVSLVVAAALPLPIVLVGDFNNTQIAHNCCHIYQLAAKRLVKYWKKRVEIFGPKAFFPLTQDNLLGAVGGMNDEDDSATHGNAIALGLGVMTLLPQTDPLGRSIVYWDPSHLDSTKYPVEAMIRAFWYVLHAALEPISAQQHGIVVLVDPQRCALSQVADASLSKLVGGAMSGVLPLRLSGIHIVHPPFFVNMVLPVIKVFMPARMQQRIQFHSGTSREVIDKLQTDYGIPISGLPTLMGGLWKLDHSGWLKSRREQGK